ncbi:hypothetical protein SISNIDRAFT_232300 [Sistotremastrum niveocremeum HHB9708]|uniref:Uncharacterized protein n=1 Tax=Sistotremastrum niveocremeum HHB9708 TaxID=1314777 RepID=A0A164Q1H7_9AGAM|nr:hypothetical protein SISNIDRAFT_232300 [Sistotremastrum niveocremeum HHB9708]
MPQKTRHGFLCFRSSVPKWTHYHWSNDRNDLELACRHQYLCCTSGSLRRDRPTPCYLRALHGDVYSPNATNATKSPRHTRTGVRCLLKISHPLVGLLDYNPRRLSYASDTHRFIPCLTGLGCSIGSRATFADHINNLESYLEIMSIRSSKSELSSKALIPRDPPAVEQERNHVTYRCLLNLPLSDLKAVEDLGSLPAT